MKRALLPISLVALGLSLLIGCFYVPTFERPVSSTQKDFRKLIGSSDSHPIRPGFVDRRTILKLLGPPPLSTADGASIGYVFEAQSGEWVWPLCFTSVDAANTAHGVRFDFGSGDVLVKFKTSTEVLYPGPFLTSDGQEFRIDKLVADLGEPNSPLLWGGNSPVTDQFNFGLPVPARHP